MNKKSNHSLHTLGWSTMALSSVSFAALFGLATAAQAQEMAGNPEAAGAIEEVEVVGIRSSMEDNIALKRDASSFVDAITSEDVGKFPDKNVADSLQRVPGISITRDGGEGSAVSVRGFGAGLTLTQFNGNFIASSPGEPNRQFDFNLLPSNMVQRVEVIKSPEARYDEGGVGGTVRVYSRKPFDMDANSFLLSSETTYSDVTEDFDPSYSMLYSWKTDSENFGFLLGYTSQTRRNRTLSSVGESWHWWRDPSTAPEPTDIHGNPTSQPASLEKGIQDAHGNRYDNGFWGPRGVRGNIFDEERERKGYQATVQFRPVDNLTLGANYFRFNLGLDSTLNSIMMPEWMITDWRGGSSSVDSLTFIGDTNQPGATLVGTSIHEDADGNGEVFDTYLPWLRANYNEEESTSDTFDVFAEYEGESFAVKFVGGRTKAEGGPRENFDLSYYTNVWPTGTDGSPIVGNATSSGSWLFDGNQLNFQFDDDLHQNLVDGIGGRADPKSTNSSFATSVQEEAFYQLDADFDVDIGILTTLRAGVKYRDADVRRITNNTYFLRPEFADIDIYDPNIDAYNYTNEDGVHIPSLDRVIAGQPIGNIIGGFSTNIFPAIDVHRFRDIVESENIRRTRAEQDQIVNISEESLAYYLQADFESGDVRGNFGVRVVESDIYNESANKVERKIDHTDNETGKNIDRVGAGIQQEVFLPSYERSTIDVLPSFNVSWEPIENVIFRGAVARTMSRPDYLDMAGITQLTYITEEYAEERGFGTRPGWTGGGGNSELRPFKAWQADLGVEWYFDQGGIIGATIFTKQIDNFIVDLEIPTTRDVEGETVNLRTYRSAANASDASISGLELFGSYIFDNGFGVSSNATFLNSEQTDVSLAGEVVGQSALPGTSDEAFNFSAFYENDKFSLRASYNYNSDRVGSIVSGLTSYQDAYDQVDVNGTYNITDNLNATFSIINLTKSEQYSYLGDDTKDRFLSNEYSGRRAYVGLNYSF